MNHRCVYCGRRIWFWQRMGWLTMRHSTLRWHAKCLWSERAGLR